MRHVLKYVMKHQVWFIISVRQREMDEHTDVTKVTIVVTP